MPEPIIEEQIQPQPSPPPVETQEPAVETQHEEGESQPRDEKGQFTSPKESKRLGGWQRKLIKKDQEIEHWKELALKNGNIALTDDQSPEEFLRIRRANLKDGVTSKVADKSEPIEIEALEHDEPEAEARPKGEVEQESKPKLTAEQLQELEAVKKFNQNLAVKIYTEEKFEKAIDALRKEKPPAELVNFVERSLAKLPNGEEVFLELGEKPRILRAFWSMEPEQTAAYVQKMSDALAAGGQGEPPKKTPTPITPVKKVATTNTGLSDDLPMDEW